MRYHLYILFCSFIFLLIISQIFKCFEKENCPLRSQADSKIAINTFYAQCNGGEVTPNLHSPSNIAHRTHSPLDKCAEKIYKQNQYRSLPVEVQIYVRSINPRSKIEELLHKDNRSLSLLH